jgi:hypothetical protein
MAIHVVKQIKSKKTLANTCIENKKAVTLHPQNGHNINI